MIRIATICLSLYWLAIFVATHLPKSSLPRLHGSDKLYHLMAFSGLAFLLAWALPVKSRLRHLNTVLIIAVLYAGLDEFTQQFIPGRTGDIRDWMADVLGVCLGLLAYSLLRAALTRVSWGQRLIRNLSR